MLGSGDSVIIAIKMEAREKFLQPQFCYLNSGE
jgi:hypothetical protein